MSKSIFVNITSWGGGDADAICSRFFFFFFFGALSMYICMYSTVTFAFQKDDERLTIGEGGEGKFLLPYVCMYMYKS